MNILLINKYLFPKGGDAISTLTTGALLSAKGHNVTFWGMDHPQNPLYPFKKLFVKNVDFNSKNSLKKQITIAANMLYSIEARGKIEALLNEFEPDIVHLNNFAHQISPSILHVFRKYSIPVVMTMRDYKIVCPTYTMLLNNKPCEKCRGRQFYHCLLNTCSKDSYTKSILNTIEMYLHHDILDIYSIIDVYISPSEFLKLKCEEMGLKGTIEYLPNFVNIEDYTPQYTHEENTITYFGRLSPEKGLLTLFRAIQGVGVMLNIMGDGPFRRELENYVKQNNISNILFHGHITGDFLKNIIKKTKFVIIPSEWYENNPRSAIEAFALGKPVIGSRIGGIPELVRDGETGFTFEPGNAEDLKDKIEKLLADSSLSVAMGKNARRFIEGELNQERYYQRLMEIYRQVIQ